MRKKNLTRGLIILDRAKCHQTKEFLDSLNNLGLKHIFIPANMTGKFKNKVKLYNIYIQKRFIKV